MSRVFVKQNYSSIIIFYARNIIMNINKMINSICNSLNLIIFLHKIFAYFQIYDVTQIIFHCWLKIEES